MSSIEKNFSFFENVLLRDLLGFMIHSFQTALSVALFQTYESLPTSQFLLSDLKRSGFVLVNSYEETTTTEPVKVFVGGTDLLCQVLSWNI